jgi:hypothetical protein
MQINNNSQTTFGSFQIKRSPELAKTMKSLSIDKLEIIEKARRELAHTKRYNLELSKDGVKIVSEPGAYFGPFRSNEWLGYNPTLRKVLDRDTVVLRQNNSDVAEVSRLGIQTPSGENLHSAKTSHDLNGIRDIPLLSRITQILDSVAVENSKLK